MGLYEGAEEILAGTDYPRDAAIGCASRCSAGFSGSPVHLHIVLGVYVLAGLLPLWTTAENGFAPAAWSVGAIPFCSKKRVRSHLNGRVQ